MIDAQALTSMFFVGCTSADFICYLLLNFIGTFAVLKLFNRGGLGDTGGRAKPDLVDIAADGQAGNSGKAGAKGGGRS